MNNVEVGGNHGKMQKMTTKKGSVNNLNQNNRIHNSV